MQPYYGTRKVAAEPQVKDGQHGYKIVYSDGYESWCPKDVFESRHQPLTSLSFGHAIEELKAGHKVARQGWNGKNMFVFLREGRKISGVDPNTPMGGDFESLPHLCMRTADGKCCVGWLASQTDILANDWQVIY